MNRDAGGSGMLSFGSRVSPAEAPEVVACVVTFNPGSDFPDNLRELCSQVESVLVVDNGSADQDFIRDTVRNCGCFLVANPRNMGISAALNQGARWAESQRAVWLLTMDQDSLLAAGSVSGLKQFIQSQPFLGSAGIVAMTHRDRSTGTHYHHRLDILREDQSCRILRTAITSGSMIRVSLFQQAGYFDESLFIDSVDHDFCLRIRRLEWLVVESRAHELEHAIGASVVYRFLGRRFVATHHAPVRRYYMTRNQLEMVRRHGLFDPIWSIKAIAHLGVVALSITLCERHALQKLGYMAKGVLHFALRRFKPIA